MWIYARIRGGRLEVAANLYGRVHVYVHVHVHVHVYVYVHVHVYVYVYVPTFADVSQPDGQFLVLTCPCAYA